MIAGGFLPLLKSFLSPINFFDMAMTPYMLERQKMKLKGAGKAASEPDTEETAKSKVSTPKTDKELKQASKAKSKIKRVSKKRAAQERAYKPVRKKFLQQHPTCEAGLKDCLGISTEIHHTAGREGERLLKVDDFKALCSNCHRKITDQSRQAIAEGHSKTRLGKPKRGKIE